MKLADIDQDKILLIRWRDILEVKEKTDLEINDADDFDRVTPIVETVGKIFGVRRGMVAVKPEWCLMKDHQDYDGHAGESVQLMPAGCIEAVFELRIGKKLYKNPLFEEEEEKPRAPETIPAT